jgi:hypothetical protein
VERSVSVLQLLVCAAGSVVLGHAEPIAAWCRDVRLVLAAIGAVQVLEMSRARFRSQSGRERCPCSVADETGCVNLTASAKSTDAALGSV